MINNDAFGGFVVSKNIVAGVPVKYTFREQSSIPQLNGWNLLSENDDEQYVQQAENFVILNATSVRKFVPQIIELFDAPYGTDLCWLYHEGVLVGFYDLEKQKEVTIEEIFLGQG